MSELSVSLDDGDIVLEWTVDDEKKSVRMDVKSALRLVGSILLCARNEGSPPKTTPLHQDPLIWFQCPALELGSDVDGRLVLALQTLSLLPIFYSIDEDSAHVLANGAKEILSIPANMRSQPKKH